MESTCKSYLKKVIPSIEEQLEFLKKISDLNLLELSDLCDKLTGFNQNLNSLHFSCNVCEFLIDYYKSKVTVAILDLEKRKNVLTKERMIGHENIKNLRRKSF
jgi:hypothetical protein